jgi:hypothetical protein
MYTQSSCIAQLDELSSVYGDKALEVALLAGRDALRFGNSLYVQGNVEGPSPEAPCLAVDRSWSLQAVQAYATKMWCVAPCYA